MDVKQALQRVLELIEDLERAQTQDELERILGELKKLAMDQMGVEGTA